MDIARLLDYGFVRYDSNFALESGDIHISVYVGPGSYSRRSGEEGDTQTHVEVAFKRNGALMRPVALPLEFPSGEGGVYAYVPVTDLCSLLPIFVPDFVYRKGMRVRDLEGDYRLRGDEVPDSNKLDAVDSAHAYCVLDKRFVQLIQLD